MVSTGVSGIHRVAAQAVMLNGPCTLPDYRQTVDRHTVRRTLMRERCVNRSPWWSWIGLAVVSCGLSPGRAIAQPAASGPVSLNDAVLLALKN
jgi:hypothetical protein